MKRYKTIAVNCTGGIIPPGYLLQALAVAEQYKITEVSFNQRQQLLLEVPAESVTGFLKACAAAQVQAGVWQQSFCNIYSSYVAVNLFCEDTWVTEGVYKDVFELLSPGPRLLNCNVCDARQTFVPLFTGHINWIAGAPKHYWYLYIRRPGSTALYCWPQLVYTNNIATVTAAVEQWITTRTAAELAGTADAAMYEAVQAAITYVGKPVEEELVLPAFYLPYYEGFNKQGGAYWLGIYRRDELFSVGFLQEVARLCLDSKIGAFYVTPWKTIIVKNITADWRRYWDVILGRYRVNVRHAANELNWWVEDASEDALIVKRTVIRHFDKEDVRTYGLCFSVQLKQTGAVFGSVLITGKKGQGRVSLKSQLRYDIWYAADFSSNSSQYLLFREGVAKEYLGTYLVSLSKLFYEQLSAAPLPVAVPAAVSAPAIQPQEVYECSRCKTIYDPQTGDPLQGVAAATPFQQLPADYGCFVCMAPVSAFVQRTV